MKVRESLLPKNSQSSSRHLNVISKQYDKFQNNMINSTIEIRIECCGNIAWKR